MALLSKLKSMLGIGDGSDDREAETTVTVEHDPDEPAGGDATTGDAAADPEAEPVIEDEPTDDAGEEPEPVADEGSEDEQEADLDDEPAATTDTDPEIDVDDAEPEPNADDAESEAEAPDVDADDSIESDVDTDEDETEEVDTAEDDTADTDADETADDDADDYSDEPLDSIKGIGPAYSERLHDAGITSIAELAEGDAEEIGEAISVSPKTVSNWIDRAAEK
ncbi:helix-hairpin-helix domain-containing protein [Halonotius roseus]|uniref:Helix-hairpin-helix domain-containing protein n=1 Tax=Halonotius roseus TaxID=2511997 RepID=A0A544QRQ0_9EURY|nr:helix-hairpin-helix domain-containing protein [Halonotius roseus]TQQ82134.1 helix-hairpin-helix domain-containing protein [Halonotius roseus]